jgi:hypothetical protein
MQMRALVLAVIVACGDSGGGGGPIAIEDLSAAVKAYACNMAVRCGIVDDLITCGKLRPLSLPVSGLDDPNVIAAAEAGLVAYDGQAAQDCLAAVTASCDRTAPSRRLPASCDLVFAGKVADQGTCEISQECIGAYCSVSCTTTCCPGTCFGTTPPAPRPALGESCTNNPSCIDSYCDATYTCVALVAAGGSCNGDQQCQVGSICTSATCTLLASEGGACQTASDCKNIGDHCGTDHTCARFALTGDMCPIGDECTPYDRCEAGVCAHGPMVGDPCGTTGQCVDASYCDQTTLMCTALLPDGAGCMYGQQCHSGSCDTTTLPGTCMAYPVCY